VETEITVYGASDDLIEIDGAIIEEFNPRGDEPVLLAFSDGTVLRIHYSDAGVWRIQPVHGGRGSELTIAQAPEDDEANYSDRATLRADIEWVVAGDAIAKRKP
jgi:hypothetical protein